MLWLLLALLVAMPVALLATPDHHAGALDVTSSRRVNWFVYPVGIGHAAWNTSSRTVDGLNNTGWALKHRRALTGYMPCCGCWDIRPNGTFVASGMCIGLDVQCTQYPGPSRPDGVPCDPRMQAERDAEIKAELAMGLDIIPTGLQHHDNLSYLLTPGADGVHAWWEQPGSMESAVDLVRRNGWAGLGYDNEASTNGVDPRLPAAFAAFIGNLSAALHGAGHRLVVDITSTWHGNLAGPELIPMYAKQAPDATYMDMAEYFNGFPNHQTMPQTLSKLGEMLGSPARAAAAVGAEMMPGHFNASCSTPKSCLD
jgi:hypothetical protein